MGVQIGVHNIAPCFVRQGWTSNGNFLEGGNMEGGLEPAGRLPGGLVGQGQGVSGRLEQKWAGR
jgi:hypothetical protein